MSRREQKIIMALDIGNTSIHIGLFVKSRLVKQFRINTYADKQHISKTLERSLNNYKTYKRFAVVSSVVPKVTDIVEAIIENDIKAKVFVIGKNLKVPIKNRYARPSQVGSDRLVNAYACKQIYGVPAIIIDFGTATTFDCINRKGEYEGGIIAPGVKITLDALAEETALLPRIDLKKPKNLIGKDTKDSIRSGVINGLACMCDGLIKKIKKGLGRSTKVIVTGGFSDIFSPYSIYMKEIDKNITLKGLYLIFSKKTSPGLDI
jgi:type III pantothenate kinase